MIEQGVFERWISKLIRKAQLYDEAFRLELLDDREDDVPTLDLTPMSWRPKALVIRPSDPNKHPFVHEVHIEFPHGGRKIFKLDRNVTKEEVDNIRRRSVNK